MVQPVYTFSWAICVLYFFFLFFLLSIPCTHFLLVFLILVKCYFLIGLTLPCLIFFFENANEFASDVQVCLFTDPCWKGFLESLNKQTWQLQQTLSASFVMWSFTWMPLKACILVFPFNPYILFGCQEFDLFCHLTAVKMPQMSFI